MRSAYILLHWLATDPTNNTVIGIKVLFYFIKYLHIRTQCLFPIDLSEPQDS